MFQKKSEVVSYDTLINLCDLGFSSNPIETYTVDDISKTSLSVSKVEIITHEQPMLIEEPESIKETFIEEPEASKETFIEESELIGTVVEEFDFSDLIIPKDKLRSRRYKQVIRVANILKTPNVSKNLKGSEVKGKIEVFDPSNSLNTVWAL